MNASNTRWKRIIGFGFFAGIVGAHNGMMKPELACHTTDRAGFQQEIFSTWYIPPISVETITIRIAVTGKEAWRNTWRFEN